MNLLLDTHTVIWFITNDSSLPISTKQAIENTDNLCFVSMASLWEMSIKHSIGKLILETTLDNIFDLISESGIDYFAISSDHILLNSTLPYHHRDPFDRLIISQAISENFTVVSKDADFEKYEIELIWD